MKHIYIKYLYFNILWQKSNFKEAESEKELLFLLESPQLSMLSIKHTLYSMEWL